MTFDYHHMYMYFHNTLQLGNRFNVSSSYVMFLRAICDIV